MLLPRQLGPRARASCAGGGAGVKDAFLYSRAMCKVIIPNHSGPPRTHSCAGQAAVHVLASAPRQHVHDESIS
jgi:hypothetical protein